VRNSSINSISRTGRPDSGSRSHSKVLYHMGVPYLTEEFTFLLKPSYDGLAARIIELEEDTMEKLGSTGELVEYGLADLP